MQPNVTLFKKTMSKFATGITVVTTKDIDGKLYGSTINSFSSVSLEPFLILFSIGSDKLLCDKIIEMKQFVVNILTESQIELSKQFCKPSLVDWQKIPHSFSKNYGCPIISECLSAVECKIHKVIPAGDHIIIVGEVADLENYQDIGPLVYFEGKYQKIGEKIEDLK